MRRLTIVTFKAGMIALSLVILVLAVPYAVTPFYAKISLPLSSNNTQIVRQPSVADQGHAHATMMVFVNGKLLNFSNARYQNKDLLMHFENGEGLPYTNIQEMPCLDYSLRA